MWERGAEAVLAGVVVVAAVSDLKKGKVYNWLTYPAIAAGLAFGALEGWAQGHAWDGLANHLAGFGLAFGVLFVAYILGGMGGGDVKLMAAVGAFVGWPGAVDAVFYSFLVAVVVGLAIVVWRGQTWTLVRRLAVAVRLLPVPGVKTDEAIPETTAGVPFGFAVCVGTLWHLAENEIGTTLWAALARLF